MDRVLVEATPGRAIIYSTTVRGIGKLSPARTTHIGLHSGISGITIAKTQLKKKERRTLRPVVRETKVHLPRPATADDVGTTVESGQKAGTSLQSLASAVESVWSLPHPQFCLFV
jgi:hypothetical protein